MTSLRRRRRAKPDDPVRLTATGRDLLLQHLLTTLRLDVRDLWLRTTLEDEVAEANRRAHRRLPPTPTDHKGTTP